VASSDLPIGIIGGGILGLAVGRELTRRYPGLEVVVFEKEDRLARHQTGHNSGVVHAGIYYKPGSLKAELCTRGRRLLHEFCSDRGLPYEECGKLVLAVEEDELGRLADLERTATHNKVPGLRRVTAEEIVEIEPHATGLTGLHSPATAITDFVAVAEAMAVDIRAAGGRLMVSNAVSEIQRTGAAITVKADDGGHRLSRLVICAGLQADRVGGSIDGNSSPRIVPFRGEYMSVVRAKEDLVKGLIYPVPDPRYPFLGVHFTRLVSGGLEVGPNAILALDREGYGRLDASIGDIASILSWPGFWRLAAKHWRSGINELRGSLFVGAYMKKASRYVPEIGPTEVVRGRTGVRAQALERDGTLVDDFRIYEEDGVFSVRNAPSPAATSSLAIAEHVVDRMTSA